MKRIVLAGTSLRVIQVLLGGGVAILLARLLGTTDFGIYTVVFSVVSFASVLAQFGLPNFLVREIAKGVVGDDRAHLATVWRWSKHLALFYCGLMLTLSACLLVMFLEYRDSKIFITAMVATLLIPLISFNALRGAALLGLQKTVPAQIPETLVRPLTMLLLVLGASFFLPLSPQVAMAAQVISIGIALLVGAWFLRCYMPNLPKGPLPRAKQRREWLLATLSLGAINGLQQINNYADNLMLAAMQSVDDVALYRAAYQLSVFAQIGLVALAAYYKPQFAALLKIGEKEKAALFARQMSRLSLLFALAFAIVVVLLASKIMTLVFGTAYEPAAYILVVLVVGQTVTALASSVTYVLTMGGMERALTKIMVLAVLLNLGLNIILIPIFAGGGAAFATVASLTFLNITAWWHVRRNTGIDCSVLGLPVVEPPK